LPRAKITLKWCGTNKFSERKSMSIDLKESASSTEPNAFVGAISWAAFSGHTLNVNEAQGKQLNTTASSAPQTFIGKPGSCAIASLEDNVTYCEQGISHAKKRTSQSRICSERDYIRN
jgi:hypothetical protein